MKEVQNDIELLDDSDCLNQVFVKGTKVILEFVKSPYFKDMGKFHEENGFGGMMGSYSRGIVK